MNQRDLVRAITERVLRVVHAPLEAQVAAPAPTTPASPCWVTSPETEGQRVPLIGWEPRSEDDGTLRLPQEGDRVLVVRTSVRAGLTQWWCAAWHPLDYGDPDDLPVDV